MRAQFFRRMAQQCRDMIGRARTQAAKSQLQLWAHEFDAQAETIENEEKNRNPHDGPHR